MAEQKSSVSSGKQLTKDSHPACHNCRRERLKCDRSLPQCSKCVRRGLECLGYQRLFRWQEGVASRGKLTGVTLGSKFGDAVSRETRAPTIPSIRKAASAQPQNLPVTLTDPLLQDLSKPSRTYLSYFASDACQSLVLYGSSHQNPFRDLVPLTHRYPVLLHIIVANSALHMFNRSRRGSMTRSKDGEVTKPFLDALIAKQRALSMLRHALTQIPAENTDIILAVVILFVEFELLDSGRDNWKYHIEGARKIIRALCQPNLLAGLTTSPIRSCLVSSWIVFDILGSTLTDSRATASHESTPKSFDPQVASLIRDAEGNHCSSFPSILLEILQVGSQLPQSLDSVSVQVKQQKLCVLICIAKAFDPVAWAADVQARSPYADIQVRTYVAHAHQAAVTIYLSRLLLSLYPTTKPFCDFEALASEVVDNITRISKTDEIFTATTWPAFIAGAETDLYEKQQIVAGIFQDLWEVQPWGLMQEASDLLKSIWAMKRDTSKDPNYSGSTTVLNNGDWIQYLKMTGTNWLII